MAVNLSPPKNILPVPGVRLAAVSSGVKGERDDLALVVFDPTAVVAGVYTQSAFAAPPVWVAKERERTARGWLANSGNANAATGEPGRKDAIDLCQQAASVLELESSSLQPFSTGVIGERLPMDKLVAAIPRLATSLKPDNWLAFASAIMTTDTVAKAVSEQVTIDGEAISVTGVAKGSGMIKPNMATMLGYIATDAAIATDALQALLNSATSKSFNAITVDSDTSTSDSVFLIATGAAGNAEIRRADDPRITEFRDALDHVMQDLATQIVRDGEGASKLITIDITGARDEASAYKIAMSVANSPLVKTAIAGEDANWGRVVMAVGKAGQSIDQCCLTIAMGGITIAKDGGRIDGFDEAPLAAHMAGDNILIEARVGDGPGAARVWTCDLTHGYISINADYRS